MDKTAVVAGVGPGLGASLSRRFAEEGCRVGLLARSGDYVERLATELRAETAGDAVGIETDITDRDGVEAAFDSVRGAFGPVEVLVNHASDATWDGVDIPPGDFERSLQVGPIGSLHCTQQVVPDMRAGDGGTIIFTGATSALRGRDGALGFSAAKFATRGMAESLARELGPAGIHVAHVVIDGQIATPDASPDGDQFLDPDAIAESYWHLIEQDRSSWTLELDVRPHVEKF